MEIWSENPFYWQRLGKPVLLLGASDEDNLFNHPNLWGNLDTLQSCGGNYVRCTMSDRDEGNVKPYARDGELYDLDRFNPEYWDRFDEFLRRTHERDIVVQVEVWATYDYCLLNRSEAGDLSGPWQFNPYNPSLNGGQTSSTRLLKEWDEPLDRRSGRSQPFFHSPPALNNDTKLLSRQQAFVRRILDSSQDYDNVLYCIDNETWTPPDWSWYWADFLRTEGVRRDRTFHVTEMWRERDIQTAQTLGSLLRPDLYSYLEISQNNRQDGQTHYDKIMWLRRKVLDSPSGARPISNVKIYSERTHAWSKQLSAQAGPRPVTPDGADPYWTPDGRDRIFDPDLAQDRFWKILFAGCASARFHRPHQGLGLGEPARQTIRAARVFSEEMDVFRCEPHADLLRTDHEDQAYCLADPGRTYGVYLPGGGAVSLETTGGRYSLRWFNPETVAFLEATEIDSRQVLLESPDDRHPWLAILKRVEDTAS